MKIIVQRVTKASVKIEGRVIGKIDRGLLLLVGFTHKDTKEIVDKMIQKCLQLRIFNDDMDKMNLSVQDTAGGVLVVSQFTLYGDCKKGRRPSFVEAMPPQEAKVLYNYFLETFKNNYSNVESGEFGADMQVSLVNDGPVTLVLTD